MPVFQKIANMIVNNDKAFLLTNKVTTGLFDEDISAFKVEIVEDAFAVICASDLIY